MTSSYLNRPLLPLAVALPRMLDKIEAELVTARPAERVPGPYVAETLTTATRRAHRP